MGCGEVVLYISYWVLVLIGLIILLFVSALLEAWDNVFTWVGLIGYVALMFLMFSWIKNL